MRQVRRFGEPPPHPMVWCPLSPLESLNLDHSRSIDLDKLSIDLDRRPSARLSAAHSPGCPPACEPVRPAARQPG